MNNKFKSLILTAFLVISVFLNLFLYEQTRNYYSLFYATELDPLGLSQFREDDQQVTTKPIAVFFGDSRAAQWTDPATENFTFINRGIGNQTSSQVANRFDMHVKPLQPTVVIVQVGVNDLKTIPLFPDRKQGIISNCKDNIWKIVQDSLELDTTVILTTIFPVGKVSFPRSLVWSNDVDEGIKEVNDYILGLSGKNVIVFDAASMLSSDEGKVKPEYKYDLLHLNGAGYQILNSELTRILEEVR